MTISIPNYQVSRAVLGQAAAAGEFYAAIFPGVDVPAEENSAAKQTLGILSIGCVLTEATETEISIAIADATTQGEANPSNLFKGLSESGEVPGAGVGTAAIVTAWTDGGPTDFSPGNYYRRVTLPASIGAAVEWTWPPEAPLILPCFGDTGQTPTLAPTGFGLLNTGASAGGVLEIYVRWGQMSLIAQPKVLNFVPIVSPFT